MTTPAPRSHNRSLMTFDAKSRRILSNGGTVRGGNGLLYKYDPNTSMAVAIPGKGIPTKANPARPAAAPAPARPPGMPAKGPMTPAERVGMVPRTPTGRTGGAGQTGPGGGVSDGAPGVVQAPIDPAQDAIDKANEARNRDAKARIMSVLAEYGLGSLADFVWQQIIGGKSDAEVMQDIRNTPEFKKRFPAIAERTKRGLAPISPGEYVAYERQARQIMRAAGLPESFYDTQEDFTNFLSVDVSISELNDRIQLGRQAVYEAPQDVRDALARDYGVSEGALTAYFLDPDRAQPLLEKQYRAAQIGGASTRTGFGALGRRQNEELAALGITGREAEQGFSTLVGSRELFTSLDRGEDTIDQGVQLGAVFGGNAAAQRRIENRRRRRQGAFEQGGSFASGQGGVLGLGDSSDF